jgi:glycosyltransferase involved in cell wall biosynthesis
MIESLVSVIIPAWNNKKYIRTCLESVMIQDYKYWECIIILAPSTDSTLNEIIPFLQDCRFKLVVEDRKTNCATARNIGYAHARGEYVVFLDADDWIAPCKLLVCMSELRLHPERDCVYHYVRHVSPAGRHLWINTAYPGLEIQGVNGGMFRHDALATLECNGKLFDESMNKADDFELAVRARFLRSKMIPRILSNYRHNPDGLSSNTSQWGWANTILSIAVKNHAWYLLPHWAGVMKNNLLGLL